MESKLHDVGDHGPTPIGSIYSVNNPSKSPKIKENLQNRIKKILLANTWLMARVRTLSKPKRTGLVLEEQFEDPEDYIINGEDWQVDDYLTLDYKNLLFLKMLTSRYLRIFEMKIKIYWFILEKNSL